mmetsp:Transcript_73371/g.174810  ORF Transcript_73371/g.174810 Transcript_73371/m.174810 type:complete len:441 (+) Transcript_73371:113-1435(+)
MWGMPSNNACIAHAGVHSAWFTKAKHDGAKTKWLGNATVRRLFTIDFEKNVLFYRHSESERSTSSPIPFSSILGATRPNDRAKVPLGSHLSMHRSLSTSLLKLAPNCVEYPIIIHTSDRRIRLNADTEAQARAWVEALNAAHRLGKGHAPKPIITQNAPAWTTGSRLACKSISPSQQSNATESTMDGEEGSEEASGDQSPTASEPSPEAAFPLSSQLSLVDESSLNAREEGGTVPPLEEQESKVQDEDIEAAWMLSSKVALEVPRTVLANDVPSPSQHKAGLRAADFGFDDDLDCDSPSECGSSAPSTPRAEAVQEMNHSVPTPATTTPEPEPEDATLETFCESEDEDAENPSLQKTLEQRRALDLRLASGTSQSRALFQKPKPSQAWDSSVVSPHNIDKIGCRMTEDLRLLDSFGSKPVRRSKKVTRSGSNPCLPVTAH